MMLKKGEAALLKSFKLALNFCRSYFFSKEFVQSKLNCDIDAVRRIIKLQAHAMSDKNHNQVPNHLFQDQFVKKKMNQQKFLPKRYSLSNSALVLVGMGKQQSLNLKDSTEFNCFKDDNLRVLDVGRRPYVERASINLFRKQKRIKWIEVLNEEHDNEPLPKQSDARKEQKINLLPMSIANFGKNSTILDHRSISQGLSREVHTSLEQKRQKGSKKASSSTKFSIQKISTSMQRYSREKKQIQHQQMKFQVLAKPMIERLPTQLRRKTKEQLKRIYSPSRIFHKPPKSSREFNQTSDQADIFKAWQLSDQGFSNEIQEYTEQLFSCETLDLRPTLKSPQRVGFIRRK